MIKVLTVVGTRPEAIKMAPIIKQLGQHSDRVLSRTCVTAQHRQMLDQVLELFHIKPNYDLNVMQNSQSPTQVAAAVLTRLEKILEAERPDWVLVQGDTTTVAAAALAAFYARIRIGHVEAGLRTFNKYHPFPEEINRRLASVLADLHFAPTLRAKEHLLREGIPETSIAVTGNPVIDALQMTAQKAYDYNSGVLSSIPWDKRIILVTAHRRENFGEPIEQICLALRDIALECADKVQIVYPVHLNPNVEQPARRILGQVPGVTLMKPLDYLPFVQLMKRATLVLTDSGGIQEEAPGLGKPVLVLREVTERPEAVDAGTVKLIGTNREQIVLQTLRLLNSSVDYDKMAHAVNPYGDGQSAKRIVDVLLHYEGEQ